MEPCEAALSPGTICASHVKSYILGAGMGAHLALMEIIQSAVGASVVAIRTREDPADAPSYRTCTSDDWSRLCVSYEGPGAQSVLEMLQQNGGDVGVPLQLRNRGTAPVWGADVPGPSVELSRMQVFPVTNPRSTTLRHIESVIVLSSSSAGSAPCFYLSLIHI